MAFIQIQGTDHLKEAFLKTIKDLGIKPSGNYTDTMIIDDNGIIGFAYRDHKLIYRSNTTGAVDYILGDDWNKALKVVKMMALNTKYKFGEEVIVTNFLQTHTTLPTIFKNLDFKKHAFNKSWSNGSKGKIFGIEIYNNNTLYALRSENGAEITGRLLSVLQTAKLQSQNYIGFMGNLLQTTK